MESASGPAPPRLLIGVEFVSGRAHRLRTTVICFRVLQIGLIPPATNARPYAPGSNFAEAA